MPRELSDGSDYPELTEVFELALAEDTAKLVGMLWRLDVEDLRRVNEAAQLLDKESQDALETSFS